MTLAKMSAGAGYAYYTKQTISGDAPRLEGQSVEDYYLQTGNPPGQWMGKQAESMGLEGHVSEQQMRRLFGDGHDPMTDAPLGRAFQKFKNEPTALEKLIEKKTAVFVDRNGRAPEEKEFRQLQMAAGDQVFRAMHGHGPGSKRELWTWMSSQIGQARHPVSGFDLTFSAPKSVSMAWAVGDQEVSGIIDRAHVQAIKETVSWFEDNHAYGRSRAGSTKVAGVTASRFRHYTNRDGEVHLHDHVTVSNKVVDKNGVWRSLDGRDVYRYGIEMSSRYNRRLVELLEDQGFRFHNDGDDGHVQMELDGISAEDRDAFSQRHAGIAEKRRQLITQFVHEHGSQPSSAQMRVLNEKAWEATRRAKGAPQSLAEVKAEARELGADRGLTPEFMAFLRRDQADAPEVDLDAGAVQIVSALETKRAVWSDNHIGAHVNMWAVEHHIRAQDIDTLTELVREKSVLLTPEIEMPSGWTQRFYGEDHRYYTSQTVMGAEKRIIEAATVEAQPSVFTGSFEKAKAAFDGPLDDGQIAVARSFCCGQNALTLGVGHAGTGKTTAMRLVAQAAAVDGVRVIGLATSEKAARLLGDEAGIEAYNVAAWLKGKTKDGIPLVLHGGDLIVVDEASMVSTPHLDAIITNAREAGARVCLLGDPKQLGAIGSGGVFRYIAQHQGASSLEAVHRFKDPEEADASVRLGHSGDVKFYIDKGRVHGVSEPTLDTEVAQRWAELTSNGADVIVTAPTNRQAASVAAEIQMMRALDDDVDLTHAVSGMDGNAIGVGDTVITRKNDSQFVVMTPQQKKYIGKRAFGAVRGVMGRSIANGDRWTVTAIGEDGSMTLCDKAGGSVTVDPTYVAESVQLGYASTVHVAQGQTVDRAIAVVDAYRSNRESLYVQMTRGKESNEVFIGLDGTATAEQVMEDVAQRKDEGLSAHEFAEAEQARVGQASTFIPALRADFHRADQERFTAIIRDVIGTVDVPDKSSLCEALVNPDDGRRHLDNALRYAERSGISPDKAIKAALMDGDLGDHPARSMTWRINRVAERAADPTRRYAFKSVELATMPDHELDALAATTRANLEAARERMQQARLNQLDTPRQSQLRNGDLVPPWTGRTHGPLSDEQLKASINDGFSRVHEADRQVRDAHTRVNTLHREWTRLRKQGVSMTSPQIAAVAGGIVAARQELDRRTGAAAQARHDVAEMMQERRLRSRLDGPSWKRETVTREVALSAGQDRARVVAGAWAAGVETERAATDIRTARALDQGVRDEQRRRLIMPRQAPWRREAPAWMGVSGALSDHHVPEPIRRQLQNKTDFVVERADAAGDRIARADLKPQWVEREAGPVPTDPQARRQWTRVVGRVETYRQLAGYIDTSRSLPVPANLPERREIGSLRAALADLRSAPHDPQEVTRGSATPEWEDRRRRVSRHDSQNQSRAMYERTRQQQARRDQAQRRQRDRQMRRDDPPMRQETTRQPETVDRDEPDDREIGDR